MPKHKKNKDKNTSGNRESSSSSDEEVERVSGRHARGESAVSDSRSVKSTASRVASKVSEQAGKVVAGAGRALEKARKMIRTREELEDEITRDPNRVSIAFRELGGTTAEGIAAARALMRVDNGKTDQSNPGWIIRRIAIMQMEAEDRGETFNWLPFRDDVMAYIDHVNAIRAEEIFGQGGATLRNRQASVIQEIRQRAETAAGETKDVAKASFMRQVAREMFTSAKSATVAATAAAKSSLFAKKTSKKVDAEESEKELDIGRPTDVVRTVTAHEGNPLGRLHIRSWQPDGTVAGTIKHGAKTKAEELQEQIEAKKGTLKPTKPGEGQERKKSFQLEPGQLESYTPKKTYTPARPGASVPPPVPPSRPILTQHSQSKAPTPPPRPAAAGTETRVRSNTAQQQIEQAAKSGKEELAGKLQERNFDIPGRESVEERIRRLQRERDDEAASNRPKTPKELFDERNKAKKDKPKN